MTNLFLVLLCGITFCVFAVATCQTTKKAWPHEKIIPAMLALLTLSLLGSFSFFLWSLLRVYQWPFKQYVDQLNQEQVCELSIFPFLPVFFLAMAVILNIDKWMYFYFRIMAEHQSSLHP